MSKSLEELARERGFLPPTEGTKKQTKICPFERQAANIGGGQCLKEKCAWWSDELNNCVVFAPIFDATESLKREIRTVLGEDVIIQGGEY